MSGPVPANQTREYGSPLAPVVLACGSEALVRILDELERCVVREEGHILLVGGEGTGKSLCCEAALALCDGGRCQAQYLSTEGEPQAVLQAAKDGTGLCISEISESLSPGVRKSLFVYLRRDRSAAIVTAASAPGVEEITLKGNGWTVLHLPTPEEDGDYALSVASLTWLQCSGSSQVLTEGFTSRALDCIRLGPWPRAFNSLSAFFVELCDALVLNGDLIDGRLTRRVTEIDVNAAIMSTFRTEQTGSAPMDRRLYLIVEGDTDVGYLVRAAELANEEWGAHLLEGCEVEPSGSGRAGGARALIRKLAALTHMGHDAIGLLDCDTQGRAAKDHAAAIDLNVICLPIAFDALGRAQDYAVEIEDLLPSTLLAQFYQTHPEFEPEESTTRGGRTRIVPKGEHKEAVMQYACSQADFGQFERLIYVVCLLWEGLGLPLPHGPAENMKTWLRSLERKA